MGDHYLVPVTFAEFALISKVFVIGLQQPQRA